MSRRHKRQPTVEELSQPTPSDLIRAAAQAEAEDQGDKSDRMRLARMLRRMEAEADEQFAWDTRKGVCRTCFQYRSQSRTCYCES